MKWEIILSTISLSTIFVVVQYDCMFVVHVDSVNAPLAAPGG